MTAHRIVGLALILGAVACAHASTFATSRNATIESAPSIIGAAGSPDVTRQQSELARSNETAHVGAHVDRADVAESVGGGAATSLHGLELRSTGYRPITLGDPCGACRSP